MAIENLTMAEPLVQVLSSYQSLVGVLKIALGGIFGLAFLVFIINAIMNWRLIRQLKSISADIKDIQERLDGFEVKEENVDRISPNDGKKKKNKK